MNYGIKYSMFLLTCLTLLAILIFFKQNIVFFYGVYPVLY